MPRPERRSPAPPARLARPDSPGMQLDTAHDLITALRESGLFTPEQLAAVRREFAPLGADTAAMFRHLLTTGHLTNYQLKKLLQDRTADLLVGDYVITDKLGSGGMGK